MRIFKLFLLFILAFSISGGAVSQTIRLKKGVVVVVRHAEKGKGTDPGLTDEGLKRSYQLFQWFSNKGIKIDQVYHSQFRRTRQTADSVINGFRPVVFQYSADENGDGLKSLFEQNFREKNAVLIVGHSNTVPDILKLFGIRAYPNDIPDAEHDNIFTIRFKKGKAKFFHEKYGSPSR